MKRLVAILLSLAAIPAAAQDAPPANQAAADRLLEEAATLGRNGDQAGALAQIDQALALVPEPSRFRGYVQCRRGAAYIASDLAIAREAIEECRRLLPDHPMTDWAVAQLLFADNKIEPAIRTMVQLIHREPDVMTDCDTSSVGQIETWLRVLTYERLDALRGELVAALIGTPCGQNDAAFFSGLALKTILERVAGGDHAGAAGLLPAVIDPDDMLVLLIDRRFDPIRAEIDRQAGPTLVPQREALLQSARNAAARSPDVATRQRLASVLVKTGHRAEGIAVLRATIGDAGADDPDQYLSAIAADRLGEYLNENGETDVARVVAPMRRLLAARSPNDAPGLWNVVPNLALWLLNYGRAREALDVLDRYQPGLEALDAPAAHAYFTALRGCAQMKLGEPAARATLDSVRAGDPGNLGARRIAALCGPYDAAQRDELLAIAGNPADAGSTLLKLVRLRTLGADGKGPPGFEDAAMLRALADPDFIARLDTLVRPLPARYRGALANWN